MSAPVIDAYLEELLHDSAHIAPAVSASAESSHATAPCSARDSSPHDATVPRTPVPHDAEPVEMPARADLPTSFDTRPVEPPAPLPAPVVETPAPHRQFVPDESTPRSVASGSRWLRVGIGNDSYGLELLCVQEVVRMAPILAMRGAAVSVLGVMNLRGRIVPVFDLGLWLGLPCVQPTDQSRIVVVERNDELIGVLVTRVEDVATLNQADVEPPLHGTVPGAFLGIARVGHTPTVLLQAEALFA